jgi:3-hydroxybutyryl-CoA dehydrogenase
MGIFEILKVTKMIQDKKFHKIAVLGMGRMSMGLAVDLALNGLSVDMIDLKERSEHERRRYRKELHEECLKIIELLERDVDSVPFPTYLTAPSGDGYDLIFEGLPEEIEIKNDALSRLKGCVGKKTLVCSMTSTFTVEELTKGMDPSFNILVTHFMNPPYLLPFLEVVPYPRIEQALVDELFSFLRSTGHMPILCKSSPGFVISRLQLGLMNEAVRLIEEKVASPEDIDRAIKYGWGYRFPVMGILEFIDVGGLEILYHAGRFVSTELNRSDLECPQLIEDRFNEGSTGIKALIGIFEYESRDQVMKTESERLKKQVQIKKLLDRIHREEGDWE